MRTYPAASLYPLVHVIGEGFAGDVAAAALGGVKVAFLQDNLALADHHRGTTAHLGALEDVVFYSLDRERENQEPSEVTIMTSIKVHIIQCCRAPDSVPIIFYKSTCFTHTHTHKHKSIKDR